MLTLDQIMDRFWQMILDGSPEERRVATQWRRDREHEYWEWVRSTEGRTTAVAA